MSVTNATYTTNSITVTIANELVDSNNMIAGINTAITALGWSLYDSIDQSTYSPMVTRVYRVINADTVTYKYAILRYDTLQLKINLSCCESWDTSAKVPTNESWHNAGLFSLGYDLRDCAIYVAATSRHLVIQSRIRNELGLWAAILEFERITPEDIASNSAPCFAYTNSLMFGTPWGQTGTTANNTPSNYMMALPRTPDNQTGAYAAKSFGTFTPRGPYPPYYPSANTGNTGANAVISVQTLDGNALHLGSYYNTNGGWGWDATKTLASPITVDNIYKSQPFGRIYNAAITKPIGQDSFDSTYATIDTSGFPSVTGSNTEMITLTLNGGDEYSQFTNTAGRLSVSYSNNVNMITGSVLAVGNTVWVASNTGVWTWSMTAGSNTSAIQRYNNSNGVIDIMFDGARSIWGTTNNGIVQIDTETYAANVNVAADLGTMGIAMDQKYIYASSRTRSTQPKIYTFWRANGNLSAHLNVGSALAAVTSFGKPTPDYRGFVYAVTQQGAQTTGSGVSRQVVWSAEAANANVGASNNTFSSVSTVNWQTAFYYEPMTTTMYFFSIEGVTTRYSVYSNVPNNNVWSTLSTSTAVFGAVATAVQANFTYSTSPAVSGTWDNVGDIVFMARRGWLWISPRRTGANLTSQTAYHTATSLQHPDSSAGPGYPQSIGYQNNSSIATSANGWAGHQWTNGVRIFQSLWLSNTEARITTLGNLYPNTQLNTYATGRLLIKA